MQKELSPIIREFITKNVVIFDEDIQFSDSDHIFELGFVNSLFAMRLLHFVEKNFNIALDSEDINIDNFSSVNKIVKLIEAKLDRACEEV